MTIYGKLSSEQADWLSQNQKLVLSEVLRSYFKWFIAKCFNALHPGTRFMPNWHIEAIAWKLEQVRCGRIRRLIITLPPRSAKSHAASVAFPAFIHGHDPSKKIIAVSYAQGLAATLHNDYRSVISSTWYR
ncbi:hypothetical protein [Vannielia litorea]|uniref:hypothetical protein n=1 Tax=Vannielia litorea TaxID=1217970 RepID=UPI001BCEA1D2|nr:hypothetical protein [Vannielia litorea]MBS8225172.1 hypothetical protein [Vannielia litorea]